VLKTERRDGYLIEHSADNFIVQPSWAVDLCRRIGFDQQLISTSSAERGATVVHRGRLQRVPRGFMLMAPGSIWPILATPILTPWGKLRLLGEVFVPRRRVAADESLAAFARRRLGREAYERIVQPLVGGIYTADPEKLSLRATMPRFIEMEQRHGSLIRAARRQPVNLESESFAAAGGARYGLFVAPRDGLATMVEAIAARLPAGTIRRNVPVRAIEHQTQGKWRLQIGPEGSGEAIHCDGLVVAIPAPAAARLLLSVDADLAQDLARIDYAGTSIVILAFRRDQIEGPLAGFGFVVPAIENRSILAASFASVKFPGRAPADHVLVRVFIGGACQPQLAVLPDEQLRKIAVDELRLLIGVRGEPQFCEIARWPAAMPQYHLGHCELVARVESEAARWPALALAGNAYHGVGIPNCIHSGRIAAERIVNQLAART
jgi:oxygen-dependent protoporphyrinogen oxidase